MSTATLQFPANPEIARRRLLELDESADWHCDTGAAAYTITTSASAEHLAAAIAAAEAGDAGPLLRAERWRVTSLIVARQNRVARQYGFTDITQACTHESDPVPAVAAMGAAFVAWRSAVRTAALAIYANVAAGNRQQPTDAELLAELPAFVPPA